MNYEIYYKTRVN